MIQFLWPLHFSCNYRCPYCYFDGAWDQLAKNNRYPSLDSIVNFWSGVYETYGSSLVVMSGGGEPTTYPNFEKILIALSQRHRVNFPTNLHWPRAWWESLARAVDPRKISICASFHPSETELDGFMEKLAALQSVAWEWLWVQIVAYPPHLNDIGSYCEKVRALGVEVYVQPFHGKFGDTAYPHGYTRQENELIKALNRAPADDLTLGRSLRENLPYAIGELSPRGKMCTAGQLYCFIDQKGDVYRCTQVVGPGSKLGNIEDGFSFLPGPAPCPADYCLCETRWLVENQKTAQPAAS